MIDHHQLSAFGVDHLHAHLGADEHRAEVVPHAEAAVEIDIAGEAAVGDRTEVEGSRAHAPELRPTGIGRWRAVDRDDRVGERDLGSRLQRLAVATRATASHCVEAIAGAVVVHHGHPRPLAIDDTEAAREPRQAERCVGRPVERIDDRDQPFTVAQATLLAEHSDTRLAEYRQDRLVGDEVRGVLISAQTGRTPVDTGGKGTHHTIGGPVQDLEYLVSGHGRSEPRRQAVGTDSGVVSHEFRGRLGAMAVIDLQGFVADLKDHVAEHGFHVHDERHFIETYTNRQTWEIDLHPDRACDGPLDMHVALEVDPRSLIHFEDEVMQVGETGEPSNDIKIPVTLSFALPPLPAGPDLLVLATDLAGIGGTDLPLEVSAVDSFAAVTDAAERAVSIVARVEVPLAQIYLGQEVLCDVLDRCQKVGEFLLDRAPAWLDEI